MKIIIPTVLALLCASVAYGANCKLNLPLTCSNLTCGDQVYHRCQTSQNAFSKCTEGRDGSEPSFKDAQCMFEYLGIINNGTANEEKGASILKRDFHQHYESLSKGVKACAEEHNKGCAAEQTVNCIHIYILQAYETTCGYKTCDWFNTID